MSEIDKRVIKGFNVDKATENQLNDLSRYELVDIVLFFREQLQRYKQAIEKIKDIAYKNLQTNLCINCDGVGLYEGCKDTSCSYYQMGKIIQKCEEVNNDK